MMTKEVPGLLERLEHVQIVSQQKYGPVETFHLRWPGGIRLEYSTLDESLAAQWIEITESTEAGRVPFIKIANHSDNRVFLMAGEQIVGCKQNRVFNTSIMIPAHSETSIPVTCVERGRWGYSSPRFSSARSSSHQRLRAMMAEQATSSYRAAGAPRSDQTAVWREISSKLGAMDLSSPSDSLQDAYRDHSQKLEETLEKLPAPTDCNGSVFAVAGRIVGADLFDKPETLRKLWPKLIKSCTIDALETKTQTPLSTTQEEVLKWLHSGVIAKEESFPSPGLGTDVRIEGEGVIGASLVVDEQPVHMELFRGPGRPGQATNSATHSG
jgi:hypothetical protein